MSSHLLAISIILLFVAITLIIIGSSGSKAKVAVGGFIGPLPFGFGNDPELVKWVIIVSVIVAIVFIIGIIGRII